LSNNKPASDGDFSNKPMLSSQPDIHNSRDSFQSVQVRNKELLTGCTNIQKQMSDNRQKRLTAQKHLNTNHRQLTFTKDENMLSARNEVMVKIRRQIFVLEEEHVALHQQFIALQTQFRQCVTDQRRQLVETINQTRSRTFSAQRAIASYVDMPSWEAANSGAFDESFSRAASLRKSA